MEIADNTFINIFDYVKKEVVENGYEKEIEWVRNINQDIDKSYFFREYVWVVVNSGMNNKVAEKIFRSFWNDGKDFNFDAVKHKYKNKSILEVFNNLDDYFSKYTKSKNKMGFLFSLPHIGKITKYHLARNLGMDFAKPDRHLVNISNIFGYENVLEFCKKISELSNERIGVVDLIFWRFATLFKDYIEIIHELI
jgi:hypothetical protein